MSEDRGFADEQSPRRLLDIHRSYSGPIWDVVSEKFTLTDDGEPLVRDFIRHPGAVAILAMNERARSCSSTSTGIRYA